ncbi:MAG: response regulator [Planctomycetota bacterium]
MADALNILMAEDNRINARVAEAMLVRDGHSVTIVSDGRSAIEAAAKRVWDLILMDIQMPKVCGLEATRQIRRREKGSGEHVAIVALTANATSEDRRRCLDAGMDGYVSKPVQRERLLCEIRTVLRQLGRRAIPAEFPKRQIAS